MSIYPKFHPNIPFAPSPHFSSRGGKSVEGIVVHYTAGGSAKGSIAWAQDPASKVSWHFIIARNGDVTQQVALDKAAWHAGASEMKYRGEMTAGANRFTIGIELANHGYLYRDKNERFLYELAGNMRRYRQKGVPVYGKLIYDNGNEIEGWWEPFPDAQIDGLDWLLKELQANDYKAAVANMAGHEEIAMPFGSRKRDPGMAFPWKRFGREDGRRTKAEIV